MDEDIAKKLTDILRVFIKSKAMGELLKASIAIQIIVSVCYSLALFGYGNKFIQSSIVSLTNITIVLCLSYSIILYSRKMRGRSKQLFISANITMLNTIKLSFGFNNQLGLLVGVLSILALVVLFTFVNKETLALESLVIRINKIIDDESRGG